LGLTTLGRILFEQMKQSAEGSEKSFNEAFEYVDEAIRLEGSNNRIAIHPYTTLFNGVGNYIKQSGALAPKQGDTVHKHLENAEQIFHYDGQLLGLASALKQQL